MNPSMIFGIIMAVIALAGGGTAGMVSLKSSTKQKELKNNFETRITLLEAKVGGQDNDIKDIKQTLTEIKELVVRMDTMFRVGATKYEGDDK